MAATSIVRGAVIEAIEALDGWYSSRWSPDIFGRDPGTDLHHTFVVSIPETTLNSQDKRQGLSDGFLAATAVEVTWAHRLAGDDQSVAYDDMLDAEEALVGAVVGISSEHVLVVRLARRAVAEGWILGTATFSATHRYPLS